MLNKIHTAASKRQAVSTFTTLMESDDTIGRWTALTVVAKQFKVSPTTINNWVNKYTQRNSTTNNTPLVSGIHTDHSGQFRVHSINLRTVDGVDVQLTTDDINRIASLASTIC
tara:strand:+ start:149 stop:487 length:339 start_codon:yes stop_codon:yes gene_type:complete